MNISDTVDLTVDAARRPRPRRRPARRPARTCASRRRRASGPSPPASAGPGRRSTRTSQPAARARRRPCAPAADGPPRADRPASSTRPRGRDGPPTRSGSCLPFGPTTSSTSSSISSCTTPSPTPTLSASSPSLAAPTSSPSASWICAGSGLSRRLQRRDDLRRGYLLHGGSSCPRGLGWRLSRSHRERTRREDRRSKFYEISDNPTRRLQTRTDTRRTQAESFRVADNDHRSRVLTQSPRRVDACVTRSP